MFFRQITDRISQVSDKVIIVYGARQVGKTTLAREIAQKYPKTKEYSCDNLDTVDWLSSNRLSVLSPYIYGYDLVIIDEAQRVKNIGLSLKLLYENFPGTTFLVTGSSSFDLVNSVSEPLTGRSREFILTPLLLKEGFESIAFADFNLKLETILKYGLYPAVVQKYHLENNLDQAEMELKNIASNYLYKDVLNFETLKFSQTVRKILIYLATCIGSEINLHKMSNYLNLDPKTIAKYLYILENLFVIFRLNVYSKRKKGEVLKNFKVYFWDVGIRNSIIQDFRSFQYRDDKGKLFENLVISEFFKQQKTYNLGENLYFWRTYSGLEVDLIVEKVGGSLEALEIKLNLETKPKTSLQKEFKDYKVFSSLDLWQMTKNVGD